jgi:hypothetical protein
MACEQPMERKTENQRLCGRRKCRLEFAALQRHGMLGRWGSSPDGKADERKSITTGFSEPVSSGPRWRQIAGPALSPEQLRLATVGAASSNWVPPKPTPGNSALIGPTDAPLNLIGGHRFANAKVAKVLPTSAIPEAAA